MDTYASDVAEIVEALDLKDVIHIGHSTGGGEVIRYVAKHGNGKVAKAVLVSAVTPIMVQNENNPNGVPISVFDDIRNNTAKHRAQFFIDITFLFTGTTEKEPMYLKAFRETGGDRE
jgi:non-heme chloroperoxidase